MGVFTLTQSTAAIDDGYYFLPNGSSCPRENTIEDVEECKTAGLSLGGNLREDSVPVSGQFASVPGGCSVQVRIFSEVEIAENVAVTIINEGDGAIHFNTDFARR